MAGIKKPLSDSFISGATDTTIDLVKDLSASNTNDQYRVAVGRGLLGVATTIYAGSVAIGMKGVLVSVIAAPTLPAFAVGAVAAVAAGSMLYVAKFALDEVNDRMSNQLNDMIESDRQVLDVMVRATSLTRDFDFFVKEPKAEPKFSLLPDKELSFDTIEPLVKFNPPMHIELIDLPKLDPPKILREPEEKGFFESFLKGWF